MFFRHCCFRLDGGFSGVPGSFVRAGYSHSNLLHLGETLSLSAEVGVRLREIQLSFLKPSLLDKPIQTSLTLYGRRFSYNQDRESSIFAFQPDIPLFNQYPQDDLLRYVSNGYGLTGFVQYAFHDHFSRVGLGYSYDVSSFRTLTDATYEDFGYFNYQDVGFVNRLSGIRTSKLTPSFVYDTVDHPVTPTQGMFFAADTAVAGLGGENDIRGFDGWSIGPIAYMPSAASVNVLNNDGSQRVQKVIVNGVAALTNVTMQIPIYRPVSIGGDTNVVANFEYRIPIRGPFAMALLAMPGSTGQAFWIVCDSIQGGSAY
jgi:outer membrane protein insertion porin family